MKTAHTHPELKGRPPVLGLMPFVSLMLVGILTPATLAHGPSRGQKQEEPTQPAARPAQIPRPDADILRILADYRAAMEARSLEKLEAVVDVNLLVLEGVHKNIGWNDYREHHIGPEMREWREFKVIDPKILEVTVAGDWAYAAQESTVRITTAETTITMASAETFVLRKEAAGWKIKHIHLSGKRLESKPGAIAP